jgi:hypothetical protein
MDNPNRATLADEAATCLQNQNKHDKFMPVIIDTKKKTGSAAGSPGNAW